jgi:hypothetical protein
LPFATRFVAAIFLFSALCGPATSQETPPQPLTPQQIHQVNKVRKFLALFDAGTGLDVQVNSGFHYTGRLGQVGTTSFTLNDAVNNKPQAIDYLDVKRVKPNRKDYMSQQLAKTAKGLPNNVVAPLIIVAAVIVLWVVVK